jgi:hypothetical protein
VQGHKIRNPTKACPCKSINQNLTSIVCFVKEKYLSSGKKQKKMQILLAPGKTFEKAPSCHSRETCASQSRYWEFT